MTWVSFFKVKKVSIATGVLRYNFTVMKTKHTSPWGPAFDNKPYLQIPVGGIVKIVNCGFSTTEAVIISELIGLSYKKGPANILAPAASLGDRCGLTRQTAARTLTKAIKLKLVLIVKEYSVEKNTARQYDIRPLLSKLNENEKVKELPIEIPKQEILARFGKANYGPSVSDPEDMSDEATVGWESCKDCHRYGPPNCKCEIEQPFN